MSEPQEEYDEFLDDLGVSPPKDETPEEKLYRELTEGKLPKIHNVQYWLKHHIFVFHDLNQKGIIVSKPSKDGRVQLSMSELVRHLLEYYFHMVWNPKFEAERPEMQHKMADMQKFLDLVIEYPTIQKIITSPREALI